MSECVIVFIILIAVQVIYSKAQEFIAPEIFNMEKIMEYNMQKLCESILGNSAYKEINECIREKLNAFRVFAVPYSKGICTVIEIYKCGIQRCDNAEDCVNEIKDIFKCAAQQLSESAEDCVNKIKDILKCTAQKPNESAQECIIDFPTLQNILECAMQKVSERTQGSTEELPTIEDMAECAGQIPSENEYIFRKQNYKNNSIKNREEL